MKTPVTACTLILAASLMGCATTPPATDQHESLAPALAHRPGEPIWVDPGHATPVDLVRLTPGDSATVFLATAVSPAPFTITGFAPLEGVEVAVSGDAQRLVITGAGAARGVLDVMGVDADGNARIVAQPVVVEPLPIRDFTFDPAGAKVERVALAGAFNGWSSERDLFTRGDDGLFRLRKAVAPGTWTYKLVVDGNWMADPANPKMDESGFGNSLLEVEGKAAEVFTLHYLSASAPGVGLQGALRGNLNPGEFIDPARTVVVVNNVALTANGFGIGSTGQSIVLSVPEQVWQSENSVTVLTTSTEGRTAEITVPVSYRDAPRSPRDEVIYYPLTDRFNDGDPSINNPPNDDRVHPLANYMGGDWAGIRQKIEDGYFRKLGVTALWVAPVNQNTPKVEQESVEPGRYFTSYHGYWPTSATETNEQFGTMDDLKLLVKTAQDNGIAILLDYVANHVHEDHPLFQNNPDLAVPLKLPDGTNNIRQFDAHPLTTWFDTFLPTLNYEGNDEIIDVMTDNAVWWIETTGADGFRHDAVKHIPTEFWRRLTEKLEERIARPQGRLIYQVGETISGHDTVVKYVAPDLLPGQFDFPTYFALQSVLGRGNGSMEDLGGAIRDAQRFYPAFSIMSPLLGNHDVARFMAYADGDLEGVNERELGFTDPPVVDHESSYDKLRLGFAFLAAIPGPPCIYYGDEIGVTGAGDPDNRRMMIWDGWSDQQTRTFGAVSKLNHARLNSVALRRGAIEVLHADSERLFVLRTAPEETVLIALSRKPENTSATLTWPEFRGTIAGLESLADGGTEATLDGNRLRFADGHHRYGVWRLEF